MGVWGGLARVGRLFYGMGVGMFMVKLDPSYFSMGCIAFTFFLGFALAVIGEIKEDA